MWDELAVLRAVLQEWLSDMDAVTEENVSVLLDLQNSIRRTLDSINKIQTRTALTAAEVEFLQARIADLFDTYVPADRRADALNELEQITASNDTLT
jgi:BMFP domain-containing protein YqiC